MFGKTVTTMFDTDKSELMLRVLDRHDATYNRGRTGWQPIQCLNREAHTHGDRTPSGSVNLVLGKYWCWACGMRGDGFDVMLELEGLKAREALEALDVNAEVKREETWLI